MTDPQMHLQSPRSLNQPANRCRSASLTSNGEMFEPGKRRLLVGGQRNVRWEDPFKFLVTLNATDEEFDRGNERLRRDRPT